MDYTKHHIIICLEAFVKTNESENFKAILSQCNEFMTRNNSVLQEKIKNFTKASKDLDKKLISFSGVDPDKIWDCLKAPS